MPKPLESCFHCGLDVPEGVEYTAVIQGEPRLMCCVGCQAVAMTIAGSGLEDFYKHRKTSTGEGATFSDNRDGFINDTLRSEISLYDQDSVQKSFVVTLDEDKTETPLKEAALVIEGITCAACIWLLEHHLNRLDGVNKANVNLTNHRARISWDDSETKLSVLLLEIYSLGYKAHPFQPDKEEELLEKEKKRAVRRLGIAGVCMMQVMMLAVALYGGAIQGIESIHVTFMRWISMVLATPVILYAAKPFFVAALRDLKTRQLSMDVPVSIAIGGAYLASVWATIFDHGEVYFDSVTMFTFFLLVGRFLEMQARHRTGRAGNALLNLLPTSAILLNGDSERLIPANELNPGDHVLVKTGHTFPADGIITEGTSAVDESALTGEYLPVGKTAGDKVIGGTINVEHPVKVKVDDIGAKSKLSSIVRLLERAHDEKPNVARLADKFASYFVVAVLITATIVGGTWAYISPEHAFSITLSVLVVTCPCALSLATPTALTAATGTLRQHGLLITRGHVLESLAGATDIVFDKTGTLTQGNLHIDKVVPFNDLSKETTLAEAAALEKLSEHPIAQAFSHIQTSFNAIDLKNVVGQGVIAKINDKTFSLGNPTFATDAVNLDSMPALPDEDAKWLLLCSEDGPRAWISVSDQIRPEAKSTLKALRNLGLDVHMLTGDSSHAVAHTAAELEIAHIVSGVSPEQKLDYINQLQSNNKQVIMVGDGINDIPVLAGAQTSVAMGSATDLAKTNADAVLVNGDLARLVTAVHLARKTQTVVKQNLSWSALYNMSALPLAAFGLIPPYLAALGMSASSLVVVGNALRLSRAKRHK